MKKWVFGEYRAAPIKHLVNWTFSADSGDSRLTPEGEEAECILIRVTAKYKIFGFWGNKSKCRKTDILPPAPYWLGNVDGIAWPGATTKGNRLLIHNFFCSMKNLNKKVRHQKRMSRKKSSRARSRKRSKGCASNSPSLKGPRLIRKQGPEQDQNTNRLKCTMSTTSRPTLKAVSQTFGTLLSCKLNLQKMRARWHRKHVGLR